MSQQRRWLRIPEISLPSAFPRDPREAIPAIRSVLEKVQVAFREVERSAKDAHGSPLKKHADSHLQTGTDPLQTPGTPTAITPDASGDPGSGPSYALEDHAHAISAAAPSHVALAGTAGSPAEGTSDSFARADHDHGAIARETEILVAGVSVGVRGKVNFVTGASAADNPGSNRVDVTVSGGGGGGGAGGAANWSSTDLTYADFSAAATVVTIDLLSLPANNAIHAIVVDCTAAFTGGAVASATLQVGIVGTLNKYYPATSVFTTGLHYSETFGVESDSGATAIKITLTTTGANTNALTSGAVTVRTLTSDTSTVTSDGPKWVKYTVTDSDVAGLGAVSEGSVTLASLPAKTVVHGVLQKTSTAFSGGSLTALTSKVGVDDATRAAFLADPDMAAHWPLNESSGNALADVGGLDLTDNNTVTSGTGDVFDRARQFTAANSEYFSHASAAALQTGDIDFAIFATCSFDSLSGRRTIVGKDNNTAGQREYYLGYDNGTNKIYGMVFVATDTPVQLFWSVAPSINTTYRIAIWHDSTANTLNMQVNGAPTQSVATGGSLQAAGGGEFRIGARQYATVEDYMDGRIGDCFLLKHLPSSTELSNFAAGLYTGLSRYAPSYDLMAATSGTNVTQPGDAEVDLPHIEDYGAATDLKATFTATGDTLDNVGAGSLDVWALLSTLP